MSKLPKTISGIQVFELDSWRQFYDLVADQLANYPACIYRGQADASWKVVTSIDRLEAQYPTRPNFSGTNPPVFNCSPASRKTHLQAFMQAMRGRRGPNPQPLTESQIWALAQHHGLATPLLDWTRSPFVALYFAFEEKSVSGDNGKLIEPNSRAIYALSSALIDKSKSESDLVPRLISPTVETSDRLLAQSGLFLEMPKETDLETYVQTKFASESSDGDGVARAVLKKIVIKNVDRTDCLKMLNKMNINRMTLFPDLDGSCQYINRMWELDFETSLGYIGD